MLAKCKQEGDSVNTYYTRLHRIWDELQNYVQLSVSDTIALIIKEKEKEQFYKFLMGLNGSMYSMVRSSIIQ